MTTTAALGALALRRDGIAAARRFAATNALPPPGRAGFDHVVVVVMENRSFDHWLGWLPHADGKQVGLSYVDRQGKAHATHPLAPDFQGCTHPDPDHSYEGGRVQYNNGACDGFLRSGQNDEYAIGYYTHRDLRFCGPAAAYWTVCDRYFAPIMAPSIPNRLYLHAGVTDRTANNPSMPATLPTIWDRLAARGLSGRYYYFTKPVIAHWGDKYKAIGRSHTQFLSDCKRGTLPNVAYVDPLFGDTAKGTTADDHPHADIRAGEYFLAQTYNAVTRSPAWRRTVLVITFDEWGGFFDHVPPPVAPDVEQAYTLRGFRVPALIISPFARRHHVAHTLYDHTSILRLIEWRWNLKPLSIRDSRANNLATALAFGRQNLHAPRITVPRVTSRPCPGG